MTKTTVKIGGFEVKDAELTAGTDTRSLTRLSIPCSSDPDLCKQLDGWDEHTGIPAFLDGNQHILFRQQYDKANDAWIMRLE